MNSIAGRVAVVTGGTRGIGRAISVALGASGAKVAVSYSADDRAATALREQLEILGAESEVVRASSTSEDDVAAFAKIVGERFGNAEILVNNAGGVIRPGHWLEQPLEKIQETLQLNLVSTMIATRIFTPPMIQAGWGRIVNISSTVAMVSGSAVAAYGAAKAGLISYTQSMARELAPHGVIVNAVAPGTIDTELTRGAPQAVTDRAISATPLGRLGETAEVADAVDFLIRASFVVGHTLVVDGGQLLNT